MTQIILMRHGLVKNPQKVIYGALPGFGLDPTGLSDVDATAHHLRDYTIAAIYCSPLQRAQETVARLQREPALATIPVTTDERLHEWVYVSEGLSYPELIERYPEVFDQYKADPTKLPSTINGTRYETFPEMEVRMGECIDAIVAAHPNQTVLVVSHGDPIIVTLAHYTKQPFVHTKETEYPRPAQTRTLQFDGETVRITEWPE